MAEKTFVFTLTAQTTVAVSAEDLESARDQAWSAIHKGEFAFALSQAQYHLDLLDIEEA